MLEKIIGLNSLKITLVVQLTISPSHARLPTLIHHIPSLYRIPGSILYIEGAINDDRIHQHSGPPHGLEQPCGRPRPCPASLGQDPDGEPLRRG